MFWIILTLFSLLSLPYVGEAKPWRYIEASKKGDAITVTIEDTVENPDTTTPKRRQVITYYLSGKQLDTTVAQDIKSGIRAKLKELNDEDTMQDVTNLLNPN